MQLLLTQPADCLKVVLNKMNSGLKTACKLGGFRITKFSSNSAVVVSSVDPDDRSMMITTAPLYLSDLIANIYTSENAPI